MLYHKFGYFPLLFHYMLICNVEDVCTGKVVLRDALCAKPHSFRLAVFIVYVL